jgi:hypothetical protein
MCAYEKARKRKNILNLSFELVKVSGNDSPNSCDASPEESPPFQAPHRRQLFYMSGLTIRNKSKTSVSKTGPRIKYTDP